MIHIVIQHPPDDPSQWVARDVDAKPPREIYRGPNAIAAMRARSEYLARVNQT